VIDADADPALVSAQVIDPLGDGLAQLLVEEVLGADLLGMATAAPFSPGVAKIPDQFLLFRIDRDDGLTFRLEGTHLLIDMLELGIAIGVVLALLGLAVSLQAVP